jgi:hypothetical protein
MAYGRSFTRKNDSSVFVRVRELWGKERRLKSRRQAERPDPTQAPCRVYGYAGTLEVSTFFAII